MNLFLIERQEKEEMKRDLDMLDLIEYPPGSGTFNQTYGDYVWALSLEDSLKEEAALKYLNYCIDDLQENK
jgi:hypothetical protein